MFFNTQELKLKNVCYCYLQITQCLHVKCKGGCWVEIQNLTNPHPHFGQMKRKPQQVEPKCRRRCHSVEYSLFPPYWWKHDLLCHSVVSVVHGPFLLFVSYMYLFLISGDETLSNCINIHCLKKEEFICVYRNSTNSQMKGQILGNYLYYWTNWSICKRSILFSRENITIRLILFYSFVNFTTLNFFYCLRYSYSILLLPIGTYCIFAGLMVT